MEKSIPLGSIIVLPGGGEAVLKYAGPVQNKNGLFAGVELIGEMSSKGKNSGEFEGVQYFRTTSPNTGLFLPYNRVLSLNQHRAINTSLSSTTRPRSPLVVSNRSTPISNHGSASRISNNLSTDLTDDIENNNISAKGNSEIILLQRKVNQLKQDYQDVLKKNQMYESQLNEKTELLNQLETTRKEHFEPALVSYEKQLNAKDAKFVKYKESRDQELKELVEAVEVLDQQAKENEVLYLNKIGELESQIENYEKERIQQQNNQDINQGSAEEIKKLQDKLMESEFRLSQLKSTNESEVNNLKEMLQSLERQRDSLLESSKDQSDQNNKENELCSQISDLQERNSNLLSQIESIKTEKSELEQRVNSISDEKDQIQSELSSLQQQIDIFTNENSSLKSQIAQQKTKYELEFSKSKSQLEAQINALKQENLNYSSKLSELQTMNSKHESQLTLISTEKDTIINDLKSQKEMLERELQTLKFASASQQTQSNPVLQTTQQHPQQHDPQQYLRVDNIIDVFNELPIYSPAKAVDASAGRSKWCGLCEREGHESIECPYENDMF